MKVYILTEGGKGIGFGHVARCSALYDAFKKKGIEPFFIINGDNSIKSLLKGKKYKIFNWLKEKAIISNVMREADVVIMDSYLADREFYHKISGLVRIPVYIDDFKRLDYPRGIVLNGTIGAENINYPRREGVRYLAGAEFVLLRREFWDVSAKRMKKNIRKVMLISGGDDEKRIIPRVLKILNQKLPNVVKKVVIGKAAAELKNIMLEADLAVSAGGQTLYELARVGTPTIAIGVAKNQMDNIRGWLNAGFIEYAGWWGSSATVKRLEFLLNKLKTKILREQHSRAGRLHVDGKGAMRVTREILAYCNR